MAKRYRILEKIYKEGTKYEERQWIPQVVDSHTLDNRIESWQFFYEHENVEEGIVWFYSEDGAMKYIESKKASDIPVKTIIHPVE